ncbi:glycerol kinase GlpK [Dokdonia sp. Hel_I_53]|uniref:glycerol kinase GlpK n=1 Tax=Dokdonia sp. Hel_I_53 TaxID=1566287 RepID=UPI001199704D|nr:glycerol kinase GlpK [Dokdonia sp. Hel_I_53]TVZ53133.1 glycerol kinase /homodimeric glycerol 3-phosphate dehydrogenase (quinone) [Dokdonia sp. Hel_I_53]
MKKKYIIAFDQGTTSTRSIIFDDAGNIRNIAQKELTQQHPQKGWVEHDPIEIYEAQKATLKEIIETSEIDIQEIAAVGITNQRETTVVWDKHTSEPIYNAIVWLDKRTNKICEQLKSQGLDNYVHKQTGLFIDSYFSGTKVKWILDNVDNAFAKAQQGDLLFGTIDSWLIWKFTNGKVHATDHSNASRTLLYNIIDLKWDVKMLDALNIPKSMLPTVQSSASDFGEIEIQGIKIPICGVAGDQQASLFGQGGYKSGIAKNTYGTGCFMMMNTGKKPYHSKNGLLTTLCASLPGQKIKYALEGSIFAGGASIKWLRDKLEIIQNAKETEQICKNTNHSEHLYVVPAFAGLGAPHWDMDAKGAIYGLTLDSDKNDIIKATVDALAYQTRDVVEAMIEDSGKQIKSLKVDGGASANDYLMQFQSDILNIEVDRPEMLEVTALGAAFIAGIQAGVWNKKDITKIRKREKCFQPIITEYQRNKQYTGWKNAVARTKSSTNLMLTAEDDTPMPFSILDRELQLKRAQLKNFDLIIIGGGVTGAGIALDASSRGMEVCLIEKNDFASGTSNKSTKLIHGGLRYLKQMEIGLVKESGSERAIVHTLAPHLVVPEKMLLPLIEGGTYGKMMTAIGLKVYDFLANVEGIDKRKMLSAEETASREPLLHKEHLIGGGYYAEYRTDDARLTIELLKKAATFGATIINYCEMKSFKYDENGKIKNLQCYDYNTEKSFKLKSNNYVSAAGPWVDLLRKKDHSMNTKHLHLTKGVHIVFSRERFPLTQSIYFDVPDGRMIFAIPRGRATYVGTTDTNYSSNLNRVVATQKDATYLLDATNNMFPEVKLTIDDIESNWAGLRPLIHEDGKDPSELSRKDEIFVSKTGLISIAGGKLTGYRKMAQRVIDRVLKEMPQKKKEKLVDSYTDKIPLTSVPLESSKEVAIYQKSILKDLIELGITDSYQSWYLASTYGKQSDTILNKMIFFINEDPQKKLIRSELWYCVHHEMCNSLSDFFVRRTGRLYFDIDSVRQYRSLVQEDMIKYLGWNESRVIKENEHLDSLIKDASTFYEVEFN